MDGQMLFASNMKEKLFTGLKMCEYCRIRQIKDDITDSIMKCSRITLVDRKEKLTKNIPKHNCKYQPQFHNYLSQLNKPTTICGTEQQYLTVCNLVLPSDVVVITDRGAQSERWIHKRPRLQSAKLKTVKPRCSIEDDESEIDDKLSNPDDDKDSELMEIQQVLEEYEIDENVQRLIQEATEYDLKLRDTQNNDGEETNKRRRKNSSKHKTKEKGKCNETKERAKTKLSRTVTLSLSRIPSPETIQVIRVDVTSNYSLDRPKGDVQFVEEDERNEEDEEGFQDDEEEGENLINYEENQIANRLYQQKSLIRNENGESELILLCQKLALSDRKYNGAQ